MEIDNQHVRVGFSNPKLIHDQNVNVVHGHNDEDIPSPTDQLLINFHIVIDNFEWTVVRYYRDILRTINEIQKDCVELQQLSFLDNSLDEILNVVSLLKLTMFIPSSVKYLELFRRSIEDYFNLLFNLYYTLSNNSKQLFKDFLFDTKQRRELYNDYVSAHQIKKKKKGMNKIFHSVTKAFTGGHGNSHSNSNGNGYGNNENGEEQLELNKKNLSVVSKNVSKTKNGGNSIHGDIRPQSGNKSLSIFNFYKSKAKTIADNVTKKSSDEMNSQDNNQTDANTFRNANQLKVCVQRGQEMSHGVLEYEISLRVISSQNKTNNNDNTTDSRSGSRSNSQNGSKVNKKKSSLPIVYTTHQRYRKFKMLWIALEDMSKSRKAESSINSDIDKNSQSYANFMELMKNPFPSLPVRAYLGFSLTDSDLALR